jgi:opacity protein-like surface antigen
MKATILLAGAAALGVSAPVAAQHHGRHDNGHHYGQTRAHHQRFARGQRFQRGYGTAYSYNRIPLNLRQRYRLNSRYRYYYDNGYYYAVDPTTMLVEQVISALTR